jgi:hypothetical protein
MTDSNSSPESMLAAFDRHRLLLFSIAYRMFGSVADAEDVVQEVYLCWQRTSDMRSPKACLSTVVTCLCLDHLRKALPGFVVRRMRINGRLGLVGYFEDGSLHNITTIDVAGTKSGPSASSSTRRSSVACRRWIGLK